MSPVPTFTKLGPQPEFNDLVNKINTLVGELQNLMLGVDSINVFEVGGWLVTQDELASQDGDVGMSTAGTAATSIRFWAGNAIPASAPFRVQQNGKMYATDGEFTGNITGSTITGGTIRTAAADNQRIELSSGSFKGYTADNLLSGLVFDPNKASDIVDLFLYHRGTKLVEFFDGITQFRIRGASGATGFTLGGNGVTTFGDGTWVFISTGSVDMQGTFKVHTGTAFDTISQANTSGLTLAQLESELNTLKGNLRSMNILA